MYATDAYLADSPTVASLRFTVQELQRSCHQQQPRDPQCADSVPYQCLQSDQAQWAPVALRYEWSLPLARRLTQTPMPAASVLTTHVCRQAATLVQPARCLQSACSRRKLVVLCLEHIHDPDIEPQRCAAAAKPAPAAPVK